MAFDIDNVFTYHAPTAEQIKRYELIRREARYFARRLNGAIPNESREKSLAFTSLQQAVMWANAAIALNE
jgi:hypothetical protein